ncbi:RNA polymerase sigma factor [Ilumatobacter nonamiensis]|uniref:RNA polymerase sigma factor n=1 Tax=Ilumatobacter nonamiensis TaxID=467093 RepID=UPI00034B8939|nr:RNA polymerase sigma factor [Ilumatobacter nonamiensis]
MVGRTAGDLVGRARSRDVDGETSARVGDALLMDAAREGDAESYAALYERHRSDVTRLARRLCRDRYEADDVVSEVFCNTLRALRGGSGPSPVMLRPYLLRSVRNTVIKIRTRSDTGHAEPTAPQALDRPDERDPFFAAGAVSSAFGAVSDRHRRVLWSVEVEGTPTRAVAESENIAAPAAASLAYRARCALRRAYIAESVSPTSVPACVPIRALIPGFVSGGLRASKAEMVRQHGDECADCARVVEAARDLQSSLSNRSPAGTLLLGIGAILSRIGHAVGGLVAATPIATVAGTTALVVGLGVIVPEEPTPADAVVPIVASAAGEPSDDTVAATEEAAASPVAASRIEPSTAGVDEWVAQLRRVPPGRAVVDPVLEYDESDRIGNVVPAAPPIEPPVADPVDVASQSEADDLGDVVRTTTGVVVDVVDQGTDVVDRTTDVVNSIVGDNLDAVVETVDRTTQDLPVVNSVVQPPLEEVAEVADRVVDQVLDEQVDELLGAVDLLGQGVGSTVDGLSDGS